jgi:CMP/dCMP kinase
MTSLVITIDGPAAAGKGTIARAIGHLFDFIILDTGMLYRLVGLDCHRAGIDPHDPVAATKRAEELAALLVKNPKLLDDPDLRGRDAGIYASIYSAIPGVRAALTQYQRDFADHPPLFPDGRHPGGAILDGRDCGTVICPNAALKFYITAHIEERAHRRHRDLQARGDDISYNNVLQDLTQRDHRDMTRAVAPTMPADDAIIIDTTNRTVDDIVAEAADWVQSRLGLAQALPDGEFSQHGEEAQN